ncbi:MAG: O-antigen ligase family protein, partial [Limisphaerales bacterium]
AVMLIPVLMKWHRPLMLFSWNVPVMLFFIRGDPSLFLVMIVLSLTAMIVERALVHKRFIHVPQITWPLVILIGVVVITAKFTGGIGLRAFGSDVYGGKKYVFLVVAILGYFAIGSLPIPAAKARKYVVLYFAGGVFCFIQDLLPVMPHFLYPLFWLIPPVGYSSLGSGLDPGTARLAGTSETGAALVSVLAALYGLRGIFLSGKLWRPVVFCISFLLIFLGGFRSSVIGMTATLLILFFLEKLHRTILLPALVIFALVAAAVIVPLAPHLPYTFQRDLTILPRSLVHVRADARADAEDSWQWRVDMWTALLPEIPKHFWLGKGYALSPEDFNAELASGAAIKNTADASQQGLALASDYHNGPLSVILPFGIWGVIAVGCFFISGLWVTYRNYRYSPPELQRLNAFLFATFIWSVIVFFGGSLAVGMSAFTGLLGLSVAINRGVRRKPAEENRNVPFSIPIRSRRLARMPVPPSLQPKRP